MQAAASAPEVRISAWIEEAWTLFQRHWKAFVPAFGAIWLATVIGGGLVVGLLVAPPLWFGAMRMALAAARGEEVWFVDLFEGFQKFVQSVLFYLAFFALTILGFALFVVPGVFFTVVTALSLAIAVDRGAGALDAFKLSYDAVRGNLGGFFLLWLAFIAFGLASAALGGLPILVFGPMWVLVQALAYRDFLGLARPQIPAGA